MSSAISAANEFIGLANADCQPVDQMKLQKLLFYAHAWSLAMNDKALFDDKVEAWPWGPVVRSVYGQTSGSGRNSITSPLKEFRKVGPGLFDFQYVTPDPLPDQDRAFVKSVWDGYKHYTGVQLSNATHETGEPWTLVKERVGHLENKPEIPVELIRDIFKAKLGAK